MVELAKKFRYRKIVAYVKKKKKHVRKRAYRKHATLHNLKRYFKLR